MSKLGQAIVLFLLITVAAPLPVARGDHNLTNGDDLYWVARRERDDKNPNKDIAYVVKIAHDALGTKLQATLWAYNGVANGKYIPRDGYPIVLRQVGPSTQANHSLRIEKCKFETTIGNRKHVLGVSLHKRAVKKNGNWKLKGRKFDRVVMRYTKKPVGSQVPKGDSQQTKGKVDQKPNAHGCPEVPEDDVLEEEPLPEDPTEEPPEYPDP